MVLDETVKFASDSSELQIDDEEVDTEEAKLCAIVEEREALLVNCNEYKVRHWKTLDMRNYCFRIIYFNANKADLISFKTDFVKNNFKN